MWIFFLSMKEVKYDRISQYTSNGVRQHVTGKMKFTIIMIMDVIINPQGPCNFYVISVVFKNFLWTPTFRYAPFQKYVFVILVKHFHRCCYLKVLSHGIKNILHLKYYSVNHDKMLINDENRNSCNTSDALINVNKGSCSRSLCEFFQLCDEGPQAPW